MVTLDRNAPPASELDHECAYVHFAERIAAVLTSSAISSCEMIAPDTRPREESWFVCQGEARFGVDVQLLTPSKTPLSRYNGLLAVAHLMNRSQEEGIWPPGVWQPEGVPETSWRRIRLTTPTESVTVAICPSSSLASIQAPLAWGEVARRHQITWSSPIHFTLYQEDVRSISSDHNSESGLQIRLPTKIAAVLPGYHLQGILSMAESRMVFSSEGGMESNEKDPVQSTDVINESVPIEVTLGEISLTVAQVLRIRRGVKIELCPMGDSPLECALRLGREHFGRGTLRFDGDKVVLIVTEVV